MRLIIQIAAMFVFVPRVFCADPTPTPPLAGHPDVFVNVVWTCLAAFLVMFMQAGFALVETGFCRAKNAVQVVMMNFVIYPLSIIGFWLVGFRLMFHPGPEVATLGLAAGWTWHPFASDNAPSLFAFFLFHSVFMDTMATIPTGAMAERWRFSTFLPYGLFVSMFLYPVYGGWMWGGGFLQQMGAVDFAGSGVVHATGGLTALAGAIVLGPRN